MMDFSMINWWAVLACFAFSMVSGAIWFGPKTFFPVWWQAIGKEGSEPAGMTKTWILLILASLIQAVFTVVVLTSLGANTAGTGMLAGFFLWLGFVATTGLTNKLFANQIKAWLIETGNHLINFLIFGAIIGGWS